MKYLKKFETAAAKNAWLASDQFVLPNVVLTEGVVEYNIYDPSTIPLYIEALEDLTISFGNTYEYSKDNSTWMSGASDTIISASAGEKVYFRASGLTPTSSKGIGTFTISNGTCNVGGNIMSMVSGADFATASSVDTYHFYQLFKTCPIVNATQLVLPALTLPNSAYREMFYNCSKLEVAPALPATKVKNYSYAGMFSYCFALKSAPALPATVLGERCYSGMFSYCRKLEVSPTLPATTLSRYCYTDMFSECSALAFIKMLATDITAFGCLNGWVSGVASSGTFVKSPAATWDVTGVNGVPSGWTVETADA